MEKLLQRFRDEFNTEFEVKEFYNEHEFEMAYRLIVNGKKSKVVLNKEFVINYDTNQNPDAVNELYLLIVDELKKENLLK